jgi:ATP-dependent Clp protease ATP-binding subunit ClpA
LLGLLREGEGLAAKVLNNLGVEIGTVRQTIESVLGQNERIIIQQIIPTSRVKQVIQISFEEARQMGHNYVGTEHESAARYRDEQRQVRQELPKAHERWRRSIKRRPKKNP